MFVPRCRVLLALAASCRWSHKHKGVLRQHLVGEINVDFIPDETNELLCEEPWILF